MRGYGGIFLLVSVVLSICPFTDAGTLTGISGQIIAVKRRVL